MLFESFGLAILNVLGIPPGVAFRKHKKSTSNETFQSSDLINSIVEITSDDVCLGSSPVYLSTDKEIPKHLRKKLDYILTEFNSIAKWAAIDLLKHGVSVYKTTVSSEKNLMLFPLVGEYKFFMDGKKQIKVYEDETEITDVLLFINYDKESLTEVSEDESDGFSGEGKFKFVVVPSPIQLKNIDKASRDLEITENSMVNYRRQVSKLVRIVSVDIGMSQGERQQEILDSVSSAINADSSTMGSTDMFDDAIPVVPNRKGLGKPDIVESLPNFNVSEMIDLEHLLGKLFLGLRFPKSYADFTQALDGTAVSTIRGDIRYSRMVDYTRGVIADTLNNYLAKSEALKTFGKLVSLTELPTPEDEDVVAAMESFNDLSNSVFKSIIQESETEDEAMLKLDMLLVSLGGVASFKYIQKWTSLIRNFIETKFQGEKEDAAMNDDGFGTDDGFETTDDDFEPLDIDEIEETDFEDTEETEPQTEQ